MALHVDTAVCALAKHGEELCGDAAQIVKTGDSVIVVLSDGLGSGVKANILATLTVKVAQTMLQHGASVDEVVETIGKTLPVCRVRKIAYSTFTVLKVSSDGKAYLAEFDNPAAFFIRDGKVTKPETVPRLAGDKVIKEAEFEVRPGDYIVMVSDGVIHAGIGAVLNLGWQWPQVAQYLEKLAADGRSAAEMASWLSTVVSQLYAGKPGDDATVVALHVRRPRTATVMVGPPGDRSKDRLAVEALMSEPGIKAVCGGTTGNLVARELGKPLEVDLTTMHTGVPPTATIEGIDVVTEGIITLSKTLEKVRSAGNPDDLDGPDGASRLARILLEADRIRFLVGTAVNPAHQNPELPINTTLKMQILEDLEGVLKEKGKRVEKVVY